MSFLNHIISSERIKVDHQKIEAVKKWPRHINPTYIRIFMVLLGYYMSYVESFSTIVSLLTKLNQNKDENLVV